MWNNNPFFSEDFFDYKKIKENVVKFNTKVINFWKDFFKDVKDVFDTDKK